MPHLLLFIMHKHKKSQHSTKGRQAQDGSWMGQHTHDSDINIINLLFWLMNCPMEAAIGNRVSVDYCKRFEVVRIFVCLSMIHVQWQFFSVDVILNGSRKGERDRAYERCVHLSLNFPKVLPDAAGTHWHWFNAPHTSAPFIGVQKLQFYLSTFRLNELQKKANFSICWGEKIVLILLARNFHVSFFFFFFNLTWF